jgi:predicted amidohydrolase
MTKVCAALVQLRTPAHQGEALAQAEPLVRQAAREGARLVLTPEGSNILQRDRARLMAAARPLEKDEAVAGLRSLARELGIWILIGSALVLREDGQMANRSILIDEKGGVADTYDKIHMFDVDLPTGERHRESALYAPGDQATVAQTPWGKLGLTVCYDVRFPYLHRALAKAGAEMIAVPAAFTVPTGEAHWEILLRARAIETGAFVLAPAQGGVHEDGRATWGRSTIVDPWGRILAKAEGDEPCVVAAELDLSEVAKARAAIPALVNEREFAAP